MLNIEKIPDQKLFEICQEYGQRARLWRQKFAGLLPEVFRRRLFEKRGFGSIYEFAAKLGGMSEEQVSRVLGIEKKFEDKPMLKNLLENGEVSINKLARIASVATPENQEFWAEQVKILPQPALETLVRDAKNRTSEIVDNALADGGFEGSFVRSHKSEEQYETGQVAGRAASLNLAPDVTKQLLELQQKGIDVDALLREFLEKRQHEIATEKEKLSLEQNILEERSRHIPAAVREIIKKEFGEKCAVPGCVKQSERLHHTNRFAMSKNHDPYFLAPLCKEHHAMAHSIDVKFREHLK